MLIPFLGTMALTGASVANATITPGPLATKVPAWCLLTKRASLTKLDGDHIINVGALGGGQGDGELAVTPGVWNAFTTAEQGDRLGLGDIIEAGCPFLTGQ